MSAKAKTVLTCLLAAAFLLLARPNAHAQADPPGVDPTHYWTYRLLDPAFSSQPINVRDQFFPVYVPEFTDSLNRLVNWVIKNTSAPRDTFLHYTWWNLRYKHPVNKFVQVTNQFGSHPVQVYNVEFLLAPAWKNYGSPTGEPPWANHYLCYRANGFPPSPLIYNLQDEWRYDVQYPGPLEYLCVPCWKEHGGVTYAPVDTVTHLAVYPILPQSDYFYPYIQDQFFQGTRLVQQRPVEYLFVPSLKDPIPTDTKRSSWGKLKTMYR